ncbi:MAG TPA: hypothetical protein VGM20_13730 [Gemmatimonadales bacterium]
MTSIFQQIFIFLFKYPPRVFQRGELVLAPVVPALVLGIGAALAAAVVFLAARGIRGTRGVDRIVLGALRLACFLVITGCLLRPALALTSAVPERNVLAVVLDDSRSMRIPDVGAETRLSAEQEAFADSTTLVKHLSDKFAVRFFRFGADAGTLTDASALRGAGARTDIAAALQSTRDELADVPVAGVVVVSDGADNGAGDLTTALVGLRARHIPVYTVGVGQERFGRDVSIDRLNVPATTLKGSGVLVSATIGTRGVNGDSVMITAEADGHIVATMPLTLPSGRDVVQVPLRLPPLDVGTHAITVRVSTLRGELITENNEAQALIRVRPPVERVLYLEGEPRPEFAFLRRAFDGDSSVRLVGLLRSAKGKFLRINVGDSLELIGGFPTRRDELFRYRALILGDVEASFFTGDQLRMIADFVDRRGGALIVLGGRSALAEGGYAGTPVADILPATLEHGGRPVADTSMATLKLAPTAAGLVHPALQLGPMPAQNVARWDSLPPLTAVNQLGDLRPGADTLLVGRSAKGVVRPILVTQRYGRGIATIFGVQDSWIWKMNPATPIDDPTYDNFWRQLVRWDLDQVADRVEVAAVPDKVGPGEPVELRARVVDSIYMDVNDAAVTASVTSPTGVEFTVPLDRTVLQDGTYAGRFVATEPGMYRFNVVAARGNDSVRAPAGAMLADSRGADMDHAELRTPLLKRIASETGGKYYPLSAIAQLPEDVVLTDSGITAHESRDLWDMPAVLIMILLLLGADWSWRRWRGLA